MDFDNRFLARDNDINFNVESRFSQKQLPNRKSAYLQQQQQRQQQMFTQNQQYQQFNNYQPQFNSQQFYAPQQKAAFMPNPSVVKQPQPRRFPSQQGYSDFILQDPPTQRPMTVGMKPVSPIKHSNMSRSASPLRNESPVYSQQYSNWNAISPVRNSSVNKAPTNVTPIKNFSMSNPDFSTPESVNSSRSSVAELHQMNIMANANNSDTDVSEDDDELSKEIKVAEELAKKAEMIAARARQKALKKKQEQEQKQKQKLSHKALADQSTERVEARELQVKKNLGKHSNSLKSDPINAFFEDARDEDAKIRSSAPERKQQTRSNGEEFKQKKNRVTREEVSNLINNSEKENSIPVYDKPQISKQELKQIKKEEEQELKKFKKFQELESKRVRKENERLQREKERLNKKKEKELLKAKKEEAKKELAEKSKNKASAKNAATFENKNHLAGEVRKSKSENPEDSSNCRSQKKKLTKKERKEEAERVRRHYEEVQRKEKRAMKEYRKSVSENNRKSVLQAFASNAVITSENTVPFDASFIPLENKSSTANRKLAPHNLQIDNIHSELAADFHSPTDMLVNGEEDSGWEDYESELEEQDKKKTDRKSLKSFMKLIHNQSSFSGNSLNNSHNKAEHIEAIVPPAYVNAANKQSDLSANSNCAAAGQHNQNRKSVNKFLFFSKKNNSGEDKIKDITPELQACTTGEFDSCFDEDDSNEFTFENSDFTVRINDKQKTNSTKPINKKVRTSLNRRSLINANQGTPVTPYIDYNEMGYLQDIIEVSDKSNEYSNKLPNPMDTDEDNSSLVSNEQNSMKKEICGTQNTSPLTNCTSVKSPKSILKSNNSTPRNQSISSFNSVSFCDKVYVKRTYSKDSYDRQSDENNTCASLDAEIIDSIKAELNQFKRQEMPVHRQSLQNTHFFEV